MTLALVREELVSVEQLQNGERLILPSGTRVTIESVDEVEPGLFAVRWWRRAERGEPGHPGGKQRTTPEERAALDGRYLGSLMAVPAGHCWKVDRG